jgi:hypothetical protein
LVRIRPRAPELRDFLYPNENAERILQGLPGWEPITAALRVAAEPGRVNADAAETQAAKLEGQEAARFLIEPEDRMPRIEPRCAGTEGSPAPNAPRRSELGAEDTRNGPVTPRPKRALTREHLTSALKSATKTSLHWFARTPYAPVLFSGPGFLAVDTSPNAKASA